MIAFHLAFRIDSIEPTRRFYRDVLGCVQGREAPNWIDFDFFGHQISGHVGPRPETTLMTTVDGKAVPLSHFGAILDWRQWETLAERIAAHEGAFVIHPQIRFRGEPGEQGTFFIKDPSANVIEFKAFRHPDAVFAGRSDDMREREQH